MRKLLLGLIVTISAAAAAPADGTDGIRPDPNRPAAIDFRRIVVPTDAPDEIAIGISGSVPAAALRPEAATSRRSVYAPLLPQDAPVTTTEETTRPTQRATTSTPPGAEELASRSMYFFHDEYIALRAGPYWGVGSKNELGTAFYGEFEFGHQIDEHAILQFQIGVLDGDDKSDGVKTEVSAIPIMVGGTGEWAIDRAEVFVSVSGGVAATEVRTKTNGERKKGSKNLWCGSVRIGGRYWITDDLFLGLDGTYLFSTSKRFGGVNTDIDGFALLFGIGLGF